VSGLAIQNKSAWQAIIMDEREDPASKIIVDSAFGIVDCRSILNGQLHIFNFQLSENAECAMPNRQGSSSS